ncbi:MAG: histidine phosphatase family protein [Christensenella sp.]
MSTSITFLRHASTDANEKGVFSGKTDLPLCNAGEAEAVKAAEALADEHFDVILYGIKKRVLQTTDYVLSQLLVLPKIILKSERITEMDFGLFEGMSADEIQKKYKKEWQQYMDDWQSFAFPNGESVEAFYERCERFIHDIVFEYENNRILIVAHKGFILACLSALLTGDMSDVFTRDIKNGEFITITV